MRLPQHEQAVVDIQKLTAYCLNPRHPRGRHKARVFASVLGLTLEHGEILRLALLAAARDSEAIPGEKDSFGQRYVVDFMMKGPLQTGRIRSSWIVLAAEGFPRLTSCYVL